MLGLRSPAGVLGRPGLRSCGQAPAGGAAAWPKGRGSSWKAQLRSIPAPRQGCTRRRRAVQPTLASAPGGPTVSSATDAVYVRGPLAPGAALAYPLNSVVVLGDVPAGATIAAGLDCIVLGELRGSAAAGVGGDSSAMLLVNKLGPGGTVSLVGRSPAAAPSRDSNLMLCLDASGAASYAAMPGTPPLTAPEAAAPKLARAAGALAALALGSALVLLPGPLLGGLLSTSAESIAGALLDCLVFGYLLLQGAGLLSDGSELLLEIVSPGVVGGVVLPVLGALPDSLIILTSLSASRTEAQEQLAIGIGTLAGSTILLLSLAWGASVLIGRCDLSERGTAIDRTLTRGWDLARTGVTVDADVQRGAALMALSVLLYGTVQVPAFLGAGNSPQAALVGAVVCLACMVAYCGYSVLFPQLQQRRIEAARKKRFRLVAVKALALRSTESGLGSLVDPAGRLNRSTARSVFEEFDRDGSGAIDSSEVEGLLVGLQLAGGGVAPAAGGPDRDYLMREFDTDQDRRISFAEFERGLGKWVDEKLSSAAGAQAGRYSSILDPRQGGAAAALVADLPAQDVAALQETAAELEGESAEDAADDLEQQGTPLSARDILLRAVAKMGAGVALCAAFSDPLVEALTSLSRATGISAFVVGFVLTPLASNSSEFVSSLQFASRKRRKNMSLTLSQVYGAVTMNSTLVLGLFLLVVHSQRLEWVYSSEVAVVVASTVAVGVLGMSRTTFPAWMALPVMALYPLSLAGVWALDTFLGWQ